MTQPYDALRLLMIADTHVPKRARDLPLQLWDEVDRADVVIHAGDWVAASLLDQLEERAAALVGVYGNNDGPELRRRLDEVAHREVAGVKFAVVHETGPATGRERRCAALYDGVDVLVFGHSHIPWDTTARRADGSVLRLLNPGSPTDRRRRPTHTWMTAQVADGAPATVTLHHLEEGAGEPVSRG